MAILNSRQTQFLNRLQATAKSMEDVFAECNALKESYAEEFASSQDNDLATADNLVSIYGFEASDVMAAINQAFTNYTKFWTNEAVATREYGKDVRRVR